MTAVEYGARVSYAKAGEEGRDAMERLLTEPDLPLSVVKVGAWVIANLATYSRISEATRVARISAVLGMARGTVSRALNMLMRKAILGWQAGMAGGKSWLALHPDFLPGERNRKEDPDADPAEVESSPAEPCNELRLHTPVSAVVTPREREVVNEKKEEERDAAGHLATNSEPASRRTAHRVPLALVTAPSPGSDDELNPQETHEVDAGFAADRLANHLFGGRADQRTMKLMFRRFLLVRQGSAIRVLEAALLGRPAKSIDCPHGYALAWIENAERKLWPAGGAVAA